MDRNMKFLVVLAIWLSCTVVFGLSCTVSLSLTYDEADKATYNQFLVQLRKELALGGTVSHSIPVLRATASNAAKYLLVKIDNVDEKEITFGLSVINAYVLAYRVGDNSYFFNDSTELKDAQNNLFTDTRQVILTAFSGNYVDFERQGASRQKTNIGIGILNNYIDTLHYTKQLDSLAKALVCVIQMTAETARFKFIENKIIEKGVYTPFMPEADIISRENSWASLSNGIQYADKDGFLQKVNKKNKLEKTTIVLADKTVAKVSEISADMGVLQHAPPR